MKTIAAILLSIAMITTPPAAQTLKANGNAKATATKKTAVELGTFTITAYCACSACCGHSHGITATGTTATEGRTISVDPSVIPLGSTVEIEGLGSFVAEDTGSAIHGNRIDLYIGDHARALSFGVQKRKVKRIKIKKTKESEEE